MAQILEINFSDTATNLNFESKTILGNAKHVAKIVARCKANGESLPQVINAYIMSKSLEEMSKRLAEGVGFEPTHDFNIVTV